MDSQTRELEQVADHGETNVESVEGETNHLNTTSVDGANSEVEDDESLFGIFDDEGDFDVHTQFKVGQKVQAFDMKVGVWYEGLVTKPCSTEKMIGIHFLGFPRKVAVVMVKAEHGRFPAVVRPLDRKKISLPRLEITRLLKDDIIYLKPANGEGPLQKETVISNDPFLGYLRTAENPEADIPYESLLKKPVTPKKKKVSTKSKKEKETTDVPKKKTKDACKVIGVGKGQTKKPEDILREPTMETPACKGEKKPDPVEVRRDATLISEVKQLNSKVDRMFAFMKDTFKDHSLVSRAGSDCSLQQSTGFNPSSPVYFETNASSLPISSFTSSPSLSSSMSEYDFPHFPTSNTSQSPDGNYEQTQMVNNCQQFSNISNATGNQGYSSTPCNSQFEAATANYSFAKSVSFGNTSYQMSTSNNNSQSFISPTNISPTNASVSCENYTSTSKQNILHNSMSLGNISYQMSNDSQYFMSPTNTSVTDAENCSSSNQNITPKHSSSTATVNIMPDNKFQKIMSSPSPYVHLNPGSNEESKSTLDDSDTDMDTSFSDGLPFISYDDCFQAWNRGKSTVTAFVGRLTHKVFSFEEIQGKNVNGRQGKSRLNPAKIAAIKGAVSKWYKSPNPHEQWAKCVVAIDKTNRQRKGEKLKKPPL